MAIQAPEPIWSGESFTGSTPLVSDEIILKIGLSNWTAVVEADQDGILTIEIWANESWKAVENIAISAGVARADVFHFFTHKVRLSFLSSSSGTIDTEIFVTME